jgi:hypothetical protein
MPTSTQNRPFKGARQNSPRPPRPKSADHEILFQNYFKSVGPRTYATQVKKAGNGNHYLVMTEGKRDETTNEVRKTRLFIYSEDFVEFFKMLKGTAEFIKANPLPEHIRRQREKFWAKNPDAGSPKASPGSAPVTAPVAAAARPTPAPEQQTRKTI